MRFRVLHLVSRQYRPSFSLSDLRAQIRNLEIGIKKKSVGVMNWYFQKMHWRILKRACLIIMELKINYPYWEPDYADLREGL